MENKKQNRFLLPIIVAITAVFLLMVIPSLVNNSSIPESSPSPQQNNNTQLITVEVDYGDQDPVQVTIGPEHTAFSALQTAVEAQKYSLETQQYDFGIFVQSINGYESTAEKSWIYFVNGEPGMVAADQVQLQPGDTVSWRYLAPTEQ